MPNPAMSVAADDADRDCFRRAVAALPPGPLRDVLTAGACARHTGVGTGIGAVCFEAFLSDRSSS